MRIIDESADFNSSVREYVNVLTSSNRGINLPVLKHGSKYKETTEHENFPDRTGSTFTKMSGAARVFLSF